VLDNSLGGSVLVTKAIIQSINAAGNRCIVRMPLFETAANQNPVTAEALINIQPGIFNNFDIGDVVFVSFEENAIEKPIVIGKLFRGVDIESNVRGGAAILDTLKVRSSATIPASTTYEFNTNVANNYKDLNTPKKVADYIKWLENYTKSLISRIEEHFLCFKAWVQWQLRPENVEIDDGDLDLQQEPPKPFMYQKEGDACKICKVCSKNNKLGYTKLPTDKNYPEI
jgi:hypothetical protein